MKETKPDHYENTPCAGKQFLDTEGFEYQLELNHPCLYKLYRIFLFIFFFLLILLISAIPCIFWWWYFYFMIYLDHDENSLEYDKVKSRIKFILFLAGIFIGIAIQSLGYMIFGIIFAIIGLVSTIIILLFIFDIITLPINLLFYFCIDDEIEYFNLTKDFVSGVGNTLEHMFE